MWMKWMAWLKWTPWMKWMKWMTNEIIKISPVCGLTLGSFVKKGLQLSELRVFKTISLRKQMKKYFRRWNSGFCAARFWFSIIFTKLIIFQPPVFNHPARYFESCRRLELQLHRFGRLHSMHQTCAAMHRRRTPRLSLAMPAQTQSTYFSMVSFRITCSDAGRKALSATSLCSVQPYPPKHNQATKETQTCNSLASSQFPLP